LLYTVHYVYLSVNLRSNYALLRIENPLSPEKVVICLLVVFKLMITLIGQRYFITIEVCDTAALIRMVECDFVYFLLIKYKDKWQVNYFILSLFCAITNALIVQFDGLAGNHCQAQFECCCGIFVK
jgi:hypothetical protein